MNVVFIGGGSFRTLPIARAAMADKQIFDNGEIRLVDFNLQRVEAVARLIMKTPEYARIKCKVSWTDKLEKALPGADLVSVSFPVGSHRACLLSQSVSEKHGFMGSDQISLSGAFRAVTGGVILFDIAKKMEKYCPKAWLVDFANPVAIYSGMINNHSKIRALGVCGGFANHRWDLTRLIFNRDELVEDYKVASAGVNHCAILLRGTLGGKDIYKLIDKNINRKNWKPCRITKAPHAEHHIRYGLERLAEMRRRFKYIMFSTEGDGMAHIFWDEMIERDLKTRKPLSAAQIDRSCREAAKNREKIDAEFRSHVNKDLDAAFWKKSFLQNPRFAPAVSDATVKVLKAIGGTSGQWLAASLPNRGAVKGFKDRTVLEYSMTLDRNGVHPDADLEVPDCFQGLLTSLATHQTLVGDAVTTRDPRIFAEALYAYPIKQNSSDAKNLWRELLKVHEKEMPGVFQKAKDYFN